MKKNELCLLIDGASWLYRAFHAMPTLINTNGEPTGAIYGVYSMLRRLAADYNPDYVAVIFDAKGKTFRDELYADYKANRAKMPHELASQIMPLFSIIKAHGWQLIQISGVEADDVIASYVATITDPGIDIIIVSGDKDLAQLVDNRVTMLDTMQDKTYDIDAVINKFGIPPTLIGDYLALIGDRSDNIPGVAKVGPKTAVKWLNAYGNLTNIVAQADKIKGKVGENLRTSLTQLALSRQLVTLKSDMQLSLSLAQLKPQKMDNVALRKLFLAYEFSTWLNELGGASNDDAYSLAKKKHYLTLVDKTAFLEWMEKIKNADLISFNIETTSLKPIEAKLVGVSFAIEENSAIYIPLGHDYADVPQQLDITWVLGQLKPLLEDPQLKKCGQNLKYDYSVLLNYGIKIQGIQHDTMLASYIMNSTATRHDIDSMAMKFLGYKTIHYEDVAGKGVKQINFSQVPLEHAGPYATEEADVTLKIHHVLEEKLKQHEKLRHIYSTIELPLLEVLSYMERNGVLLDVDNLKSQSVSLDKNMSEITKEAYLIAGCTFNLESPKQIQEILFNQMHLPVLKKTPKGQPSTAESVLSELAENYPLPRMILEYRSMSKLKSTYTDALVKQVNKNTGRVHTSYTQAVAATGRLSSNQPNLQNIPIRTAAGRKIRQAFIAENGRQIMAADYSQIELRIMAHISKDSALLDAFAKSKDIHKATAAEVFAVDIDAVTTEQRRAAKAINFGLIYGMSAFGLANQLNVEQSQAKQYIDDYFTRYPGVKNYMEATREIAKETGFVETILGRRLYIPDIKSPNFHLRSYAERSAINAPMQGSAADIIKIAMITIHRWLEKNNHPFKMIMQVHDELVFEVPKDEIKKASQLINEHMVKALTLDVPLVVDIGVGEHWDAAH